MSIIAYARTTEENLVLFASFVNDEAQFRPKKTSEKILCYYLVEKLFNKLVGTFVNMVVVIDRVKYNDRAPAIIIAPGRGGEVSHGFQGERSGGQSLSSKYEGGGGL